MSDVTSTPIEADPRWTTGPVVAPPAGGLSHLTAGPAAAHPTAPALVVHLQDGGVRRWTYRELDLEVESRARALRTAGLRRGDRALLVTTRTPDLVPTVLALLRLGVAYVPVEGQIGRAHV